MYVVKKVMRAFKGLGSVFAAEMSVRIELALSLGVIAFAWWLGATRFELVLVVAAASAVLVLESVNTVLERVIDLAEPRYRDAVREVKDAMAGLVLLAVLGAFAAILLVLWPLAAARFSGAG
ncbi:MAG: diacylglycerol kinase [Parcubacteria group bacterium]|nr:diacylglycerol kinase [Parcubacteria group bacterium]